MKKSIKSHHFAYSLALVLSVLFLPAALSAQDTNEAATKSLAATKKFIGFIRYEKSDQAMAFVGIDAMSRYLLGAAHAQTKPEDLQKFKSLLGDYIRLKAFPLALKYFKDVDLSYDQPVVQGKEARIKSSLMYGGSEQIVFTWVLTEENGSFVVTDFLDAKGVSSMQTNRDKQIQPLLQKKGIAGVNAALEKLVADLKK